MTHSATYDFDVYQSRNPKASAYYKCVETHFEELEQAWNYMYSSCLGFWRTYVMTVIYEYLDCGDLHTGFASIVVQTYIDFLNLYSLIQVQIQGCW